MSLPQAPRKDATAPANAWGGGAGKRGVGAAAMEEVPCSQAEVLAAAAVAAHNPFPVGEVGWHVGRDVPVLLVGFFFVGAHVACWFYVVLCWPVPGLLFVRAT